ncbi:MAG: DUF2911 domain-containing protein [Bryobacteraceae bacterium]
MTNRILFGASLLIAGALAVTAQPKQRVSPHETTSATIGGKKITIEYGRPYVKGRNVWAGPLAPFGKVWRTGADEATKLTTGADLMIGPLHVPAGSYSLFTIPGEKEWTLILNKVADQWGAYKYDQNQDLGRVKMTARKLSTPIEQLTISIEPQGGSRGVLKIAWSDMEASVPVMVH